MTTAKTPKQLAPRRTALITGASLGIGLELARNFAADGIDLILVARSEDKLRALATDLAKAHGITAHVIALDLALPGAAARLKAEVDQRGLVVDYLVNNAGFGQYGRFLDIDGAEDTKMLQLLMVVLTELTRAFGKDMVARRQGRIMNVASTAAFQPGPMMATYYASKAYVLSLSEALDNELREQGVTVTALCPGPTHSGFQDTAQMHGSRMLKLGMMDSATVARQGFKGMMRGKTVVITGTANCILANSVRFTPRKVVTRLSRYIADRKAS